MRRGALPGASFVWGTIADAAGILAPAVRGRVPADRAPFWRVWPLPAEAEAAPYVDLEATVERFESAGVATTGIISASEDDWDRYESLHWRAVEEWPAEQPAGAGADGVGADHERFRRDYCRTNRALLGWAIFVGRRV